MAESGASTLESSDSEESGSSEGDEVEIVVDSMKSTNLRGNNGM